MGHAAVEGISTAMGDLEEVKGRVNGEHKRNRICKSNYE
jgi:hypothetical protein